MRLIDADTLEKEMCSGCEYNTNKYANCDDCAIANAPTIDAGWIPCSEKLPSEEGLYMVTQKTFSDDYRFIDLFHYGKPLMPNRKVKGACWYRSDSEWGDVIYDDTDILAWMPLPKPYRGDSK